MGGLERVGRGAIVAEAERSFDDARLSVHRAAP
jgi:hypothetical protein